MLKASNQKKYFTPREVAEVLRVSPITVRMWSQKGELESVFTPGGHRRYLKEHIEAFAKERNLPLSMLERHGMRVLIVDDDEQFAQYLQELLDDRPEIEKTKVAHNGFRAGSLIFTFEPDLILLDLRMPYVDGFSVCNDLKQGELTNSIRVIAMSGFYGKTNLQRILQAGAETCLKKPFSTEELYQAMGLKLDEQ